MSHLDTAYKMGAAKAAEDFKAELNKAAVAATAPPAADIAARAQQNIPVGNLPTRGAPAAPPMARQPGGAPPKIPLKTTGY